MIIGTRGIVVSINFSVEDDVDTTGAGGFMPGGVPPPSGSLLGGGSMYS